MGLIFKSKKEREEDKQIDDYLKEYEKIEEEADKEKINIFSLLQKDPLEEELKQYMSEEQLEQEKNDKKNNKILIIISSSIMAVIMVIALVIILVANYNMQDDLHKITAKELKEYYNNKYGTKTSIDEIKYICYTNQDRKEECTDIVYATTKDNHIILKKNEIIGDNNNTSSIYNSYKQDILQYIPSDKLITNNPIISYKDFYYNYYQYIDYIKVLPNKSYNELKDSKKLTIRDFIIYQGDIDENQIKGLIDTLNSDSELVLLKQKNGMPINIKVINQSAITSIDITAQINLDDGIINYQLDTNLNNTSTVSLIKVAGSSIKPLIDGTEFNNTFSLKIDKLRSYRDDEINRDNLPSYYLVSFNNLTDNNIIQFNGNNELKKEEYKYLYYINTSNKTYVFATDDISIGNASYNKKK
ncbi:MAG: hypothetical protein IKP76_02735 [Bacilli bacterium]|nr:hypothetical protein [Bacilli bacterium]